MCCDSQYTLTLYITYLLTYVICIFVLIFVTCYFSVYQYLLPPLIHRHHLFSDNCLENKRGYYSPNCCRFPRWSGLEDPMILLIGIWKRGASKMQLPFTLLAKKTWPSSPSSWGFWNSRGSNSDVGYWASDSPANLWLISWAVTGTSGWYSYCWNYGYYIILFIVVDLYCPNCTVFCAVLLDCFHCGIRRWPLPLDVGESLAGCMVVEGDRCPQIRDDPWLSAWRPLWCLYLRIRRKEPCVCVVVVGRLSFGTTGPLTNRKGRGRFQPLRHIGALTG